MGRRTKIIMESKESVALKKLRQLKGISVRKLAEALGISHTLVSHLELGRANISKRYIDSFLDVLNLSETDWKIALGGGRAYQEASKKKITDDCVDKLKGLSEDKLLLLKSILSDL